MTKTEKAAGLSPSDWRSIRLTVCGLIEDARRSLARQVNSTTVFLFWRIGQRDPSRRPALQRAEYGQRL